MKQEQDVFVVRVKASTPFAALCANVEDADRLKALQESWGYEATLEHYRGAVAMDAFAGDRLAVNMVLWKVDNG